MKIVYFINKTNGFPKSMISFMETNFPEYDKSYYTIDRRKEENLPILSNVHRILSYKEFILNRELLEDLRTADKIIVSGVFTLQYVLPIYGKKIMEKTYWQFWGGDYEVLRKKNLSVKLKLTKCIVTYCIRCAKGIILLTKPERKAFEEVFGNIANDKLYTAVVPSGQEDENILMKARDEHKVVKSNIIVIGNSATDSNQHLDIFQKMKHLDTEKIKICCPLSYGEAQYREDVIKKGKEIFGDRFYPITEYMSYEKYVDFLNSCDVGIYNNNRQQALGNISLMLNLGKKVYVPELTKQYYEQFGYKLYSISEVEFTNIENVLKYDTNVMENNIQCYEQRKKVIYREWEKILTE
ncbi:TDP-N-acetylfucosamine:lipid II N-acetylfucosaminyltransferase [Blautia faecis]|uniref:TDP-N-acetylfucosamine:lipid II N-acetylfucosaminyltransferase n=1 Tax=Blautia faecis TaxID=871665 RepID=UPI0022E68AF6|nr:TDP-N-acetylfucosamine:lipid II N-acetylfucosaminyltransferase [Blautia faecis]